MTQLRLSAAWLRSAAASDGSDRFRPVLTDPENTRPRKKAGVFTSGDCKARAVRVLGTGQALQRVATCSFDTLTGKPERFTAADLATTQSIGTGAVLTRLAM